MRKSIITSVFMASLFLVACNNETENHDHGDHGHSHEDHGHDHGDHGHDHGDGDHDHEHHEQEEFTISSDSIANE